MWKQLGLTLLVLLILANFGLAFVAYIRVNNFRKSSCDGVPDFSGDETLYKGIIGPLPLLGLKGYVTVLFHKDGTAKITVSTKDDDPDPSTFSGTKWVYDKQNCNVVAVLDPDLMQKIHGSLPGTDIDSVLPQDKYGNFTLTGIIAGTIPVKASLKKA